MRSPSFEGFYDSLGHFPCLNGRDELSYFVISQQNGSVLLDETGIASRTNIVRHGRLEFTLPPEHHKRNQFRFVDAEKLL